jgi:hypothetical protein
MPEWDQKPWIMDIEDPQNRVPVAGVFANGAQFTLARNASGTYSVTKPAGGLPQAWLKCELTEAGTDWPDIVQPPYAPTRDVAFANAGRTNLVRLHQQPTKPNPRYLVGWLRDLNNNYLCDIRMYQVPDQVINNGESCALLIILVHVPYSHKLNDGSVYGHS